MRRFVLGLIAGCSFALAALLSAPAYVLAQNYGSGSYGSCGYGNCPISIVSSGRVDLPVAPTTAGVCTVGSGTVVVSTNSSAGYNLQLSSSSTQTALTDGSNRLAATSGTAASPAVMAMNSWGYRVDRGSFGNGPTSGQQSGPVPVQTFAAISSSNSPATLANYTSLRPSPDNMTVWFGVCANMSQPVGSYTGTVMYTAIVNP